MSVTVIVGEQRGDEGKGRFSDMLAAEHEVVVRFNGGDNAGHTVVTPDGRKLALHSIPSGIAYDHTMNIIGRGCLLNMASLDREAEAVRDGGFAISEENLMISSGTHLTLPHHRIIDAARESTDKKQGSTGSGIAPVASDKYMREGLRAEIINNDIDRLTKDVKDGILEQSLPRDWARIILALMAVNDSSDDRVEAIVEQFADETSEAYTVSALKFADYITDADLYLNKRLKENPKTKILAEGAQAFWLDIDHGMWPYVTSSSTTAGGLTNGSGVPPHHIKENIGVSKLMPSHVGDGPFVTEELDEDQLAKMHGDMSANDAEKGTTTGRVRRLGHLDLPYIRRSQMVNGTTQMAVTKLDWIPRYGETIKICTSYERTKIDPETGEAIVKELEIAPDAAYKLKQCTPIYEELPTWTENISDVRKFRHLPKNAKKYIRFIEKQTGVPISMIGVGPGRDQVIDRRNQLWFKRLAKRFIPARLASAA